MNLIDRLDSPIAARPVRDSSKHETAAVCRDRAAADLLAAAAMINANQRLRMESSAASWAARALFLERIEEGAARKTLGAVPPVLPE
jgi:hypothetical protein